MQERQERTFTPATKADIRRPARYIRYRPISELGNVCFGYVSLARSRGGQTIGGVDFAAIAFRSL